MAQLLFFDEKHSYTVDGVELPAVSSILRFLSREVYSDINQYTLDAAARRGTAVHEACEMLDKYRRVECDDEYAPYLQAYIAFLKDYNVSWVDIEKRMFHKDKMYAGTIDRFGSVGGVSSLVDIKTSSVVQKTVVKAQLNGYESMRICNGETPAEVLYCLQLMKTGKYRLYEVEKDSTEFDACYNLHTALGRKHERGKIE